MFFPFESNILCLSTVYMFHAKWPWYRNAQFHQRVGHRWVHHFNWFFLVTWIVWNMFWGDPPHWNAIAKSRLYEGNLLFWGTPNSVAILNLKPSRGPGPFFGSSEVWPWHSSGSFSIAKRGSEIAGSAQWYLYQRGLLVGVISGNHGSNHQKSAEIEPPQINADISTQKWIRSLKNCFTLWNICDGIVYIGTGYTSHVHTSVTHANLDYVPNWPLLLDVFVFGKTNHHMVSRAYQKNTGTTGYEILICFYH